MELMRIEDEPALLVLVYRIPPPRYIPVVADSLKIELSKISGQIHARNCMDTLFLMTSIYLRIGKY